jgi:DNA-binding transcriptional LysR family regulator
MDLRQLRYFTALAEEKHFGRAARRLSLSQPPLSQAIKQLEAELGVTLFHRTSRHVSLTEAGTVLYREASAIMRRTSDAETLVRDVARGRRGRLRVGFSGSSVYRGLPAILNAFRARFPDVEIGLREMNSLEQIEALQHDEIDVGFPLGRGPTAGLDGFRYMSEPFVLCLPRSRLGSLGADEREPVDLSLLAGEEFILFARDVSPAYYESIVALCVGAGFAPIVRFEVRQWLTIVALVAHGLGIALVPKAMMSSGLSDVAFRTIASTSVQSEAWCVWRAAETLAPTIGEFVEEVRRHRSG